MWHVQAVFMIRCAGCMSKQKSWLDFPKGGTPFLFCARSIRIPVQGLLACRHCIDQCLPGALVNFAYNLVAIAWNSIVPTLSQGKSWFRTILYTTFWGSSQGSFVENIAMLLTDVRPKEKGRGNSALPASLMWRAKSCFLWLRLNVDMRSSSVMSRKWAGVLSRRSSWLLKQSRNDCCTDNSKLPRIGLIYKAAHPEAQEQNQQYVKGPASVTRILNFNSSMPICMAGS